MLSAGIMPVYSVVCCVRISPDGKLLATGCNRNTTLYDTKTGAMVAQLAEDEEDKTDNYVRAVAFSPDGKRIASGSEDRIIRIWDLASRRLLTDLEGHTSEIYSLVFSPDGSQLLSGSGDKTARIWNVASGTLLKTLRIHEEIKNDKGMVLDSGVTSVAVTPDMRILVASSLDNIVRIWDVAKSEIILRLRGHKESVYSVNFLPGGKKLITGSLDKSIKIWDLTRLYEAVGNGVRIDPDSFHIPCQQTFTGHKVRLLLPFREQAEPRASLCGKHTC